MMDGEEGLNELSTTSGPLDAQETTLGPQAMQSLRVCAKNPLAELTGCFLCVYRNPKNPERRDKKEAANIAAAYCLSLMSNEQLARLDAGRVPVIGLGYCHDDFSSDWLIC